MSRIPAADRRPVEATSEVAYGQCSADTARQLTEQIRMSGRGRRIVSRRIGRHAERLRQMVLQPYLRPWLAGERRRYPSIEVSTSIRITGSRRCRCRWIADERRVERRRDYLFQLEADLNADGDFAARALGVELEEKVASMVGLVTTETGRVCVSTPDQLTEWDSWSDAELDGWMTTVADAVIQACATGDRDRLYDLLAVYLPLCSCLVEWLQGRRRGSTGAAS